MNLFEAINAALETPVSRHDLLVIDPDGEVYRDIRCPHCLGRGHFFSAGTCWDCRGQTRVRRHLGRPANKTIREVLAGPGD